jgi:hypothetical protein
MSKYDALGKYLKNQHSEHVPMTFRQIEAITGTALPASKRYPAWWSNNTTNNVMTKIWLDAGYRSEQVDIEREKLTFRRTRAPKKAMQEDAIMFKHSTSGSFSVAHSLFGALKGTFTIEPVWDLTKPALEREELDIDKTADLIDSGLHGTQ